MNFKPRHMFIILSVFFLIYSFTIYLKPLSIKEDLRFNKKLAADGRLIWQSCNCQSCHQLYSLGGYLGPDLTNIVSNPNKGEKVIRAMIKSGVKQMPGFVLSDYEMNSLIEFLKSTDASGKSDCRDFKVNEFLMIERK